MSWRFPGYDSWLWLAGLIFTLLGLAALLFWSTGCSRGVDPKVAALSLSAEECWRDGDMRIQYSATCKQAVGSLAELVEQHPECQKVFGDGGSVRLSCEGLK